MSAGCHFNQHKRRQLERQHWAPVGLGTRVVHPMGLVLRSGLYLPYVQDQASWIRAFVFVYPLEASWITGPMSGRAKCTARYPDAARLNHSTRAIALLQHSCEPPSVVRNFVVHEELIAELLITVHVRAALTACASSEPHEPKHQAWAGSMLTSCNTFRE